MKPYMLLIPVAIVFLGFALAESALADEQANREHRHDSSFSLISLVKPLGVTTLSFVCTTFLTGLFRKKLGRRFLKIHLPLAATSVALGVTHGILVFILHR